MDNICKFSSALEGEQELFAFQFVYETQPDKLIWPHYYSYFCCHLVTGGSAVFETDKGTWHLQNGDIFFTFPSDKFNCTERNEFKYLYIAFVGRRPTELLKSMGITREQPVFRGHDGISDFWVNSLKQCTTKNLAFMAKGVLYCTFAHMQCELHEEVSARQGLDDVVHEVRSAVEREYANPDLTIEVFADYYGYSPKYLSRRFRDLTGVAFLDYLTACRIRHAAVLLTESDKTIREVASAVGYKDALYFSKVYKKRMGISPINYRKNRG